MPYVQSIDLDEYIRQLQKLKRVIKKKQSEGNANFQSVVLYSSTDDEGNSYNPVYFLPDIKYINADSRGFSGQVDAMDIFDSIDDCTKAEVPMENITAVVVIN